LVLVGATPTMVFMSDQTIALVTGAGQGIGYEVAAGLGAFGWSVGIGDRNELVPQEAAAKLRADGVDAFEVPIDVTEDESVHTAATLIDDRAADSTCWSITPAPPAVCRKSPRWSVQTACARR
jgi:NAD(P)-dependent dehydrogenase (short-subunit alcohol dehydrogenase family)